MKKNKMNTNESKFKVENEKSNIFFNFMDYDFPIIEVYYADENNLKCEVVTTSHQVKTLEGKIRSNYLILIYKMDRLGEDKIIKYSKSIVDLYFDLEAYEKSAEY